MKHLFKTATLLFSSYMIATPALAAGMAEKFVTSQHKFELTKITTGLTNPWGLDWLPDGRMIVTERPGNLRIVAKDGSLSLPIAGLPRIESKFRDGLLDVAVSPSFNSDHSIFIAYTNKKNDERWLEIASAKLAHDKLSSVKVIFSTSVKTKKDQGFGARIRFDKAGHMLISVGDHAIGKEAQNTANALGSIIRINKDGSPVKGNPGGKLNPAIYAYGVKNPQGLTVDRSTGDIWFTDHSGKGGGEINKLHAGKNYGWPSRSFTKGKKPGAASQNHFVDPFFTWGAAPTVALSGLELYSGNDFPNWKGDLFAGSLSQETIIRIIRNENGAIIGTENIIDDVIGRIREVRQGPDNRLYVLNDDPEGGIYRIDPVK